MKAKTLSFQVGNDFDPRILFEIEILNELNERVLILNTICKVMTASPMEYISLGRLLLPFDVMILPPKGVKTFLFELPMSYEKIRSIEEIRKDDVWLDIDMYIWYFIVDDKFCPREFRWDTVRVTSENRFCVRIPESDWIRVRDKLLSRKTKIIEVSLETHESLEKFQKRIKAKTLDQAIHEALLIVERTLNEREKGSVK